MTLTLMERINQQNLTPSQKRLAEYVLTHYQKAAFQTTSELSKAVGVSEATIVRFAHALGYLGFPALQKVLREKLTKQLNTLDRLQLSPEKEPQNMLSAMLTTDIHNLERTRQEITPIQFSNAVNLIINAKKIYIVSLRSAASLGMFLHFYLNLLLKNCIIINGSGTVFEDLSGMQAGDVVIGISFPRYSRQTIESLSYAKHKGAQVIALTDTIVSPLVRFADVYLTAHSELPSFIDSFVAPLSVINALIASVALQNKQQTEATLSSLEDIWDRFHIYYEE